MSICKTAFEHFLNYPLRFRKDSWPCLNRVILGHFDHPTIHPDLWLSTRSLDHGHLQFLWEENQCWSFSVDSFKIQWFPKLTEKFFTVEEKHIKISIKGLLEQNPLPLTAIGQIHSVYDVTPGKHCLCACRSSSIWWSNTTHSRFTEHTHFEEYKDMQESQG